MNKLNLLLKLLIVLVFALFFSIIGINKKTIDSFNDKSKLEDNIDNLRGIIWSNYTFVIVSISIALTIIVTKKYYQKYKWTVLFALFFIVLNTGLVAFEEITIKKYNEVEVSHLNNVYIISSIMNIVYFILFIRLIKITDDITKPYEPTALEVDEYIREGPYVTQINRRYPVDDDDEPSYFEGAYGNRYGEHRMGDVELTSDDVEFDEDMGITFRNNPRAHRPSY